MALVTTPGSATANSYAAIAAADAYHLANGNSAWTGADALKEAALIRATAWIDATFRGRWSGARINGRLQALDWPRGGAVDTDGWHVDEATIPAEVVAATCEAAVREIVTPFALTPDVTPGAMKVLTGLKGITWTPLRASADPVDMVPVLTIVNGLLTRLIAMNATHLVRA